MNDHGEVGIDAGFWAASRVLRWALRNPRIAAAPRVAAATVFAVLLGLSNSAAAMDFVEALERVDYALRNNPSKAADFALDSCHQRRNFAVQLYDSGQVARAERSLQFCFDTLEIGKKSVSKKESAPSVEAVQARAARELEKALTLTPNLENGLKIYRDCALCHQPEGWGLTSGMVPQLAGQHREVIIKQLADIRAGNRDALPMIPYATVEAIGGAQAVADVSGYIDTLEISVENGKGPGSDLELGERVYRDNCARCHGAEGEGDATKYVPRIQAQHYKYLLRQFGWIQEGKRRNANAEMVKQIQGFSERDTKAVLDYVSRIEPPEMLRAPPGWQNPDFAERTSK